ncbi:hypothetical protein ABGT23_20115 [Enterobacter cloacae]|uniref:hypothetical protein n=1 Tax=Enterobacter cloacae TaxID=550 RepID=UPI00345DD51C
MPRIMSKKHVQNIVNLIRNWPVDTALSWEKICHASRDILGWSTPPTRQALDKKPAIKFAYKTKKDAIRKEKDQLALIPAPRSTLDAMKKINRLQQENELLKTELSRMAETANRFIYNASLAGISREQLMSPLSAIGGRTNVKRRTNKDRT